MSWRAGRNLALKLCFFGLAFGAVGEQIVRIASAHNAGASQSQGNARGVNSDPASAPLLGHVCCRPRAACWIENKVAWIGGHQNAAFCDTLICLDNINLI